MPEPLKNMYNESFFGGFVTAFTTVYPSLNATKFMNDIYKDDWDSLELKQRMRRISIVIHEHLPSEYQEATEYIIKLIDVLKSSDEHMSFEYMFLADFIEVYGVNNYKVSIRAIEHVTKFTSCEFAIRPFLLKYPDRTIPQMLLWSKHPNAMVRRLSSEGIRPRLPWAMGLPDLKKYPVPILPILENLKNDSSESVRRSVANNLNDISKDHPEMVLAIAKDWSKENNKQMNWLVRHACRTLLKRGHKDTLAFFGYKTNKAIKIKNLNILTPEVNIGDNLNFEFEINNLSSKKHMVRIEYAIYFMKANGKQLPKVFKISEKELVENASVKIQRKQSFREITTRKLYSGSHKLSIIVNGKEYIEQPFELLN